MNTETIGVYTGIAIRKEGLPGVVLISSDKIAAYAFGAKSKKPVWRYRFKDTTHRDEYINKWFDGVAQHEATKAKRRAEQKNSSSLIKMGDIFVCSWGYDQTNVDFYQITKIKGTQTVEVTEIASSMPGGETGFMTGHVIAHPNHFKGKPIIKRVSVYNGKPSLRISSFEYATPWDGKPERTSWYA